MHWHDLRNEGACRLLADGVDIRCATTIQAAGLSDFGPGLTARRVIVNGAGTESQQLKDVPDSIVLSSPTTRKTFEFGRLGQLNREE